MKSASRCRQRSTFLAMGTHILFCVHPTYPPTLTTIPSTKNSTAPSKIYTPQTPPFYLANQTAPNKNMNSDCTPSVHIPMVRGHTPAISSPVDSSPTMLLHQTYLNDSQFLELVPHSRTCHTSDPIPMSLITFYSSQAYLRPSHCACR